MAKSTQLPKVVQDPQHPVEPELLAQAILDVSKGAQALLDGPLKRRAILVLIRDSMTPPAPMDVISRVLDAAAGLAKEYTKRA